MSDELQRVIGAMEARVETLLKRVGRLEAAFITIGATAVGVIAAILMKQAGLW